MSQGGRGSTEPPESASISATSPAHPTVAVRLGGQAPPDPTVLQDVGRAALRLTGRLLLYAGTATFLVLAGVLAGIWLDAGDPRLPTTLREAPGLSGFVAAVDARRAETRALGAWREALDRRLETLHADLLDVADAVQRLKSAGGGGGGPTPASLAALERALADHDLQNRLDGDVRWCTLLHLHGRTADACDGLELALRNLDVASHPSTGGPAPSASPSRR